MGSVGKGRASAGIERPALACRVRERKQFSTVSGCGPGWKERAKIRTQASGWIAHGLPSAFPILLALNANSPFRSACLTPSLLNASRSSAVNKSFGFVDLDTIPMNLGRCLSSSRRSGFGEEPDALRVDAGLRPLGAFDDGGGGIVPDKREGMAEAGFSGEKTTHGSGSTGRGAT